MRTRVMRIAAVTALAVALAGCAGGSAAEDADAGATDDTEETGDAESDDDDDGDESAEAAGPTGDITVLTNRTDLVETTFQEYKAAFEAEYPGVTVAFEALTDYEGEVSTRMSTSDYGDVLLIPNSVAPSDLPDFFEPLGTVDELADTYRFVTGEANYEGQVYGIAVAGNVNGIVYNTAVWEAAGVEGAPTTPDEFIAALQSVADNTDAIPLYTNYADGWPLSQWEGLVGVVTADPLARHSMTDLDAPWADGEEHGVIDGLLHDVVAAGLTEEDPTTTNWEESKTLLGTGGVSAMVLGSWSITQMQDAADDPADIGYLPFPVQVDGSFQATAGGDYKNGINVNSEHKEAARAWIEWFASESGYAADQGGLSPLLDGPTPDTFGDFETLGVEYVEAAPAPEGEEGLVDEIDSEAEIGLWSADYRQRLIDAARGASGETEADVFDDLNARWSAARDSVLG